jgi:hypothetical protein
MSDITQILNAIDQGDTKAAGAHWNGLGHFFAAAAEAMCPILVEQGRRKGRIPHGGGRQHEG